MSQDQVAVAASMSRVTLGSIERAEHAATLATYFRVTTALDVPLWRLVDLDRSNCGLTPAAAVGKSPARWPPATAGRSGDLSAGVWRCRVP